MMPPKIDVCIEGYNIEQTDFYIAHIIDKYNSLNELYQKSCEHIVFLEKDIKNGFDASLAEMEKRILSKIDSFEQRLSRLENGENVNCEETSEMNNQSDFDSTVQDDINDQHYKAELDDFHSELEDLKSIFKK